MRGVSGLQVVSGCVLLVAAVWAADGPFTQADARALQNPIPYDAKSIANGKSLFLKSCARCHGESGKAADANLTEPKRFKNGASDGEIFRSIRDGSGNGMPAFRDPSVSEQDTWHLVNFIRSIGPIAFRPKAALNAPVKVQF